jgi:hypothetical protein
LSIKILLQIDFTSVINSEKLIMILWRRFFKDFRVLSVAVKWTTSSKETIKIYAACTCKSIKNNSCTKSRCIFGAERRKLKDNNLIFNTAWKWKNFSNFFKFTLQHNKEQEFSFSFNQIEVRTISLPAAKLNISTRRRNE